jgi:signal transduction histidine kinase/ActR/RegA family two-component response regulator
MNGELRALCVEDSEDDFLLVVRHLEKGGWKPVCERVDSADAMRRALELSDCDAILSDFRMPGFDAWSALRLAKELAPGTPFILVSGAIGEETAAEVMRAGADDCVMKDNLKRLPASIERALREAAARRETELQLQVSRETLLQAQKLEAVGRLAGGVAHDFNNILAWIISYSEFLIEAIPADDPRSGDAAEIKRAAQRAKALTRQLLAFSCQQVLEPRVISLNAVAQDMEQLLVRMAREDVKLTFMLDPKLGSVTADPAQMGQVLLNLVVNAREAIAAEGQIIVETSDLDLADAAVHKDFILPPGRYALLTVSDTGRGMPPEVLEHLFEPFFTTKKRSEGGGLGLSTVYGIVSQSAGHITIYSQVGQGTTVKIYLPRVDQPAQAPAEAKPAADAVGGGETVLLAEDDEFVRKAASRILRSRGYRLIEAKDGEEALSLAAAHTGTIDMLLTDVIMPQMDGSRLRDKLCGARPGIKCLFMSGYTGALVAQKGIIEAGTAYLQKPFAAAELLQKVRQVLDEPPRAG